MKFLETELETKIITKVPTVTQFESAKPSEVFKVAIIDTETTGLNFKKDSIIELGFEIIEYSKDGLMYDVIERYNELNEPETPISEVITSVTGITNEELIGHKIDWNDVEARLSDVDLFIAHNAGFDRKFLEKHSDVFKNKPWGCSQTNVDWVNNFGSGRSNQEFLVWKVCDSYYSAHRAIDDVTALTFLLSHKGFNGDTALKSIINESSQPSFKIKAVRAPFDDKDNLKEMGCRWNAPDKVWEATATQKTYEDVLQAMKEASPSCTPKTIEISSLDRFSVREA